MIYQIKKDYVVRLLYLIPLIIFVIILFSNLKDLKLISSLGIKYIYVFIVPLLIFAYQTLRNSIFGWILVMLLFMLYAGIWIKDLISMHSLIGAKYTYGQYYSWWIFVAIYFSIGFIYFKYKPKGRFW